MENFLLRTEKFKKTLSSKKIPLVNKRSVDSFDKLNDDSFTNNDMIDK